ncbi:high mobility group box domain-containing protein, partial [Globomyces pollinis-pini]
PRPPNSFILFRRDVAPRMKDRYPSLSNIQISKRLGNLWRIAPLHVKEVYTMRYQKAKEVFEQNNPGYKLQRRSTHDIKRR